MSVSNGPSTVTSGLVFDYDMSNTKKSWKGAATTNLVDPSWASWGTDGSGQGSIGTRTITDAYECTIVDSTANTRQSIYISSGISASTVYTFSVQYKKLYGTPTLRFQIQAYNGGTYLNTMSFATTAQLGITDTGEWQTAQITLTTPASTNRILWFMQDGDDYTTYTHSFSLKNVQCEQQSFATPFVVGTRSTSQAIVDLTNNNTLTANSLTYASDGTFSFNGSNSLTIPFNSSAFTFNNEQTIIIWMKNQSPSSARRNPYDQAYAGAGTITHENDAGFNYYYGIGGSNNSPYTNLYSSFNVVVGETAMICFTRNTSTVSCYKNGAFSNSMANPYGAVVTGTNNITIGSGYAGGFAGSIYAVQLYNRALSALEVQQNFNAMKSRFGL